MLILGGVLLLIASVGILIYLWTQVPVSLPLALLLWAVVLGSSLLSVGLPGWQVGCHERRKAEIVTANLDFSPTQLGLTLSDCHFLAVLTNNFKCLFSILSMLNMLRGETNGRTQRRTL
jgi:hypothetical protein